VRIHTSATAQQIRDVIRALPTVGLHDGLPESGSATHPRAFELQLEGSGGRNNTGRYGAGNYNGATWDEWGAVLGGIFRADPKARMGGTVRHPSYADAENFHIITGERFVEPGIPTDTHFRHRWVGTRDEFTCAHKAGCSAIWRPGWRA
jgi:hypothetical protein